VYLRSIFRGQVRNLSSSEVEVAEVKRANNSDVASIGTRCNAIYGKNVSYQKAHV